jgi:tetratricopeptide (TPR) repeat protein
MSNLLEQINSNIKLLEKQGSSSLLDHDDAYVAQATPLKPAEQLKEQHLRANKEYLRAESLYQDFRHGLKLIRDQLPDKIAPDEWDKIQKELANTSQSLHTFIETDENQDPTYMQSALGISDDTCWHFYDYGMTLFKQSQYDDARCIMELLVNLAPYSPSFWLSYAYCYQMQNQLNEAVEIYKTAQHVHPENVPLFLFSADCHVLLKNYEEAHTEILQAKQNVEGDKEAAQWKPKIKSMEYILQSRSQT